ncbi:MAG: hypothetical protein ACREYF_22890 [Gammaproteobacteria bacterium]
MGKKHERREVAEHFPDAVVRQMVSLDLNLIDHYDEQLRVLEQILCRATQATL